VPHNIKNPTILSREAIHVRTNLQNIDDVLWKEAGCSSELDYTEQTSWMLFLKYLDDLEGERAIESELMGKQYNFIID